MFRPASAACSLNFAVITFIVTGVENDELLVFIIRLDVLTGDILGA
jgi:hypothetical protein